MSSEETLFLRGHENNLFVTGTAYILFCDDCKLIRLEHVQPDVQHYKLSYVQLAATKPVIIHHFFKPMSEINVL